MNTHLFTRTSTKPPGKVAKRADLMALAEWCPTAEILGDETNPIVKIELPEHGLREVRALVEGTLIFVTAEHYLPGPVLPNAHRAPCVSAHYTWRFALPHPIHAEHRSTEVDGSVVTLYFGQP